MIRCCIHGNLPLIFSSHCRSVLCIHVFFLRTHGRLAQLVARQIPNLKVRSSILLLVIVLFQGKLFLPRNYPLYRRPMLEVLWGSIRQVDVECNNSQRPPAPLLAFNKIACSLNVSGCGNVRYGTQPSFFTDKGLESTFLYYFGFLMRLRIIR